MDKFTVREMELRAEYELSGLSEMTEEDVKSRVEEYAVETKSKPEGWYKSRDYPDELPEVDDPLIELLSRRRINMVSRHCKGGYEGEPCTTQDLWMKHVSCSGKCYYSGLEYSIEDSKSPLYLTLSRLDHSQGYTASNTFLCCKFVSAAKKGWSLEELLPLWESLVSHLDSRS